MKLNTLIGLFFVCVILPSRDTTQRSGQWKIKRPMPMANTFACFLDELILEDESFQVTFVTEQKDGTQKKHTFKGRQKQHEDYLELERVGSLHQLRWDADAINFEFDYDTSLGYFCAYLEWEGHTHQAFNAAGKRVVAQTNKAKLPKRTLP
ncbi:MAG: hypothetical protein ACON42_07740 [Flavobacteriaceae bacterium]